MVLRRSHLLLALFETLVTLSNSKQRFTIVFRTMGSDLQDIAEAITLFAAKGRHPNYPDFHNECLVLGAEHMAQGKWNQPQGTNEDAMYQLWRDGDIVASGDKEVLHFLHSHTICGIVDDYPF